MHNQNHTHERRQPVLSTARVRFSRVGGGTETIFQHLRPFFRGEGLNNILVYQENSERKYDNGFDRPDNPGWGCIFFEDSIG